MENGVKKVTINRLKVVPTWFQRNPFSHGRYRLLQGEEQAQELAGGSTITFRKNTLSIFSARAGHDSVTNSFPFRVPPGEGTMSGQQKAW